jgi:hexosaminidase
MQFVPVDKVQIVPNLALGKPVTTTADIDPDFPPARLTDGVADVVGSYWLGYPNPVSATIDLGKSIEFNRIDVVAFYAAGHSAHYRVSVSQDGKEWRLIADASKQTQGAPREGYLHKFENQSARYVRLECASSGQHPATMSRIHEVRVFMDPER